MSRFSICIATRNRSEYLERHVRHIGGFQKLDYELIVSDNGSTDDTPDVMARLVQEYPRIHYVRQEIPLNSLQSISASCASATGDFLMFIADDDYAMEEGLLRASDIMLDAPDVAAVYGGWYPIHAGETLEHAIETGEGKSERQDRLFTREDIVELYSGNWQMELPIFRRDVYLKSHTPYHCLMPFDFYGMARFLRYGKVMMIRDSIALVEQHEGQNSKNIYHDELIYSYLSDYELFAREIPDDVPAEVHHLISEKLVRQYMWAGEKAAMDGKYLIGKHFMQKALAYRYEETLQRAARFTRMYLLDMIAEAVVQFVSITQPNSTILFETGDILEAVKQRVLKQCGDLGLTIETVSLSEAELIARPLNEDEVFIVRNGDIGDIRLQKFGVPARKLRSLEQFMHACRV